MGAAETAGGLKEETDRHATIVLASDPTSLATARSFVSSMLDVWECEDEAEVVALLTSEIVSNAVRHAVGSVGLEVAIVQQGDLRVQARDHSPHAAVEKRSNPGGAGGHGLQIVAALASRWGVERYEDTKVVWFETPVSRRLPAPSSTPASASGTPAVLGPT
jgi:anti-sigma regulatory factor (Ser/Thr protein kinase)